ncbi:PHD finger protein 12 MRG binding domain-containing protein [Phthorimaea operculella]|nr:PHD finger protein 12 MRG binding domain-containing protein [Phthorimaea operculella]
MSNVSYDLDTSGGLMPLIRALIKPPDEEANGQKAKKPQHPYYKRPGKGHNHDSCDACGEGGDLICCDRCPASFHLVCYDPPLDENDIPAGLWLCKECRGSDAEAEKEAGTRSSRAQSPADEPRSLRNKKSKEVKEEDKHEKEKDLEKEKELTPMEILVKAAKIMNPRQFELPREMRVPCPFPGTDKEGTKNGTTALVTVDSSGCVPLPAKTCFVCSGTCKMAPLLQCDYCPLLFHQDCLDPPLTALPTGRWMCPNHVEQYIDWKLVNSVSATERVALWDQFSGPVDQHAIKIDFIRRARKANPSFRIKVPAGVRGRVVVPPMVRHHYENPPPLLPSRREYVRCKNVLKTLQAHDYEMSEEEDAPKHTICMNLECPEYKGQGKCPHSEEKLKGASERDAQADLQAITETKVDIGSDSDSLSDSDFEYLTSPVKRRKVADKPPTGRNTRLTLSGHDDASALLAAVDEQLEKLDDRLVKLLAWQRLQQVLVGEQCAGPWRRMPLSTQAEELVQRSIDRHKLAKYGFKHVALPSELLSRGERERISRAVWGAASSLSPPPPASPGHSLSDAVVKATVCAVLRPARHGLGDGLGRPIPMRLSRLTVGSDSGCDVVLDHTKCRHVSPRHATIFYDEVTQHFELINYSEWGSLVNGVVYTCDVSLAAPAPVQDDARVMAVRDIVAKRPQPKLNGLLSSDRAPAGHPCTCPASPLPSGAWEGSALVPHGALLQFGCQMFVFSITDAPVFPYEQGQVGQAQPAEQADSEIDRRIHTYALVPHGALLQFGCQMFVFSITDAPVFPYEQGQVGQAQPAEQAASEVL